MDWRGALAKCKRVFELGQMAAQVDKEMEDGGLQKSRRRRAMQQWMMEWNCLKGSRTL